MTKSIVVLELCLHCAHCRDISCQLLFPDVYRAYGENCLMEGMDPLGMGGLVAVLKCVQLWLQNTALGTSALLSSVYQRHKNAR